MVSCLLRAVCHSFILTGRLSPKSSCESHCPATDLSLWKRMYTANAHKVPHELTNRRHSEGSFIRKRTELAVKSR